MIGAREILLVGLLAVLMSAAWAAGVWTSRRRSKHAPERFADASLALLGLLLAFTFSMALSKHNQRRVRVVTDANAIGSFYTTVSMAPKPERGDLQSLIRQYVALRLSVSDRLPSDPAFAAAVLRSEEMQTEMTALVSQAIDRGTPIAVPLVMNLNTLIDQHALRVAAFFDRLPASILILLLLSASLCMFLKGYQSGRSAGAAAFIVLVTLAFYSILDLDDPQRGLIRPDQTAMTRLAQAIGT